MKAKRTAKLIICFICLSSLILSAPMLYFMLFDFFAWILQQDISTPYIGIISFILHYPVQFWMGADFISGMWSSLRMKTFNMDSLIAIGTSTAYFYSVINFITYYVQNRSYIGLLGQKFRSCILKPLHFSSRLYFLENGWKKRTKGQTSDAIKTDGTSAKTARVIRSGETSDIPVDQVVVGDMILVRPGEKFLLMEKSQRIFGNR